MQTRHWSVGDVYPGAGPSTMLSTGPGYTRSGFYRGGPTPEGSPQVTPSAGRAAGISVGEFTLAEATIGLLVLLGVIAYFDKRVL